MNNSIAKLKLEGMDCPSCAVDIDITLEDLPGIKNAQTSYPNSTITINYDSDVVSFETIQQEIKKLGFNATD